MKKQLPKPENWQDFESLCKELWGEIWKIPNKIKKNGRNGQAQVGVDVYGIPKGESKYWGIQCKGKNEYTHAQLKKSEVDEEIKKAQNFRPTLEVFIFATSANKDVTIEEYIREKDIENRENGGFEILLYCWEDIVDLIEDNPNTYRYYVKEQQFKTKYDFNAYLNDFKKGHIIKPQFKKTIVKYKLAENYQDQQVDQFLSGGLFTASPSQAPRARIAKTRSPFGFHEETKAKCSFEVIMKNMGNQVIEDWYFTLWIEGEYREFGESAMQTFHLNHHYDENKVSYSRKDKRPIVQNSNFRFTSHITPLPDEYEIPIRWELIARDFQTEGSLTLKVEPEIDEEIIEEEVYKKSDLRDDEIFYEAKE